MKKKMNVAILGYGTIGKGVFQILKEKDEFVVVKIFDRKEKFDIDYISLFTDDFNSILNDDTIDIVVEVLGGKDFAYTITKKAMEKGKHVITANKEVVASYLPTLTKLAEECNVRYLFEASVGGGIPLIAPLLNVKEVSKITRIRGILNGTTNFILTRIKEGMSFDDALSLAKAKGFAEADPTADLEGLDMVRKIAILSMLSFDTVIDLEKVSHIPVTELRDADFIKAREEKKVWKYICEATLEKDTVNLGVIPVLVEESDILATINDEMNIVMLDTIPNGPLAMVGKGAGSLPTASSIVTDCYRIYHDIYLCSFNELNHYKTVGK